MEDFGGNKAFARYSSFSVDPESYGYMLHVSGFTDGGAGQFVVAEAVSGFSDIQAMIFSPKTALTTFHTNI